MEQFKMTGYPSVDRPWLKYYSEEAKNAKLPECTIYEYLWECNKEHLNDVALEYFGKTISFSNLFKHIDLVAQAFAAAGVVKGDIVSIAMPATPEAVYAFYALGRIGAISNMIDPRTSLKGIHDYLVETRSKVFMVIDSCYDKVRETLQASVVERVVLVSPAESMPPLYRAGYRLKSGQVKCDAKLGSISIQRWSEFVVPPKRLALKSVQYEKNLPVAIIHTGGTTGVPKGVLLSNDNFNALALQLAVANIGFKRGHRWLDIMPPFIAYGVGNALHVPLVIGMQTILIPTFDPKRFDELLLKHRPNHMAGVPIYWEYVVRSKRLKGKNLSFILSAGVGGDSMNTNLEVEVNAYLKEHGSSAVITKGYGMTELSSAACTCTQSCNMIGSVGIPLIGNNIGVFSPDTDEELTYDEKGELCISGPTVMLGYYDNQEATKTVIKVHRDQKCWIHSQDIAHISKNGLLYIDGRIKRIIIRSGFKIYPAIIESVLKMHPAVYDCVVVGILNQDGENVPSAHIILQEAYREDATAVQNDLENLSIQHLPEYALPASYHFRDLFPHTSVGKVDYRALERETNERD